MIALSSCTAMRSNLPQGDYRINFNKDDYSFSQQLTGEAETIKVFGIDFSRLFTKKMGSVHSRGSVPVFGSAFTNRTDEYAAFNLIEKNPGYDIVFFPSFERKKTKFLFFFSITNVKVRARLAKIN